MIIKIVEVNIAGLLEWSFAPITYRVCKETVFVRISVGIYVIFIIITINVQDSIRVLSYMCI